MKPISPRLADLLYVSAAFGSVDQPWRPGYLCSAYRAIFCHKFKPRNMTCAFRKPTLCGPRRFVLDSKSGQVIINARMAGDGMNFKAALVPVVLIFPYVENVGGRLRPTVE